jgi:hypothetical protein
MLGDTSVWSSFCCHACASFQAEKFWPVINGLPKNLRAKSGLTWYATKLRGLKELSAAKAETRSPSV